MAISPAMSTDGSHEDDLVMPGFRFHPTEEELIDFYLRRKVEGRRFNVDLIASLDLYRYDPWELPAMAAIGEKEWFFYVPRDRKYRNGDRPNRVTISGYWKATGVDRVIRSESSSKPIGLKKTLVFYEGKAPKGVRTSWIMNEYRLLQSQTDRFHMAEIALCRVYKRADVGDRYRRRTLCKTISSMKSSSSKPSTLTSLQEEVPSSNTVMGNNIKPALHHSTNTDCFLSARCLLPSAPTSSSAAGESSQMQAHMQSSAQYQLLLRHLSLGSMPVSLSAASEKLWE